MRLGTRMQLCLMPAATIHMLPTTMLSPIWPLSTLLKEPKNDLRWFWTTHANGQSQIMVEWKAWAFWIQPWVHTSECWTLRQRLYRLKTDETVLPHLQGIDEVTQVRRRDVNQPLAPKLQHESRERRQQRSFCKETLLAESWQPGSTSW